MKRVIGLTSAPLIALTWLLVSGCASPVSQPLPASETPTTTPSVYPANGHLNLTHQNIFVSGDDQILYVDLVTQESHLLQLPFADTDHCLVTGEKALVLCQDRSRFYSYDPISGRTTPLPLGEVAGGTLSPDQAMLIAIDQDWNLSLFDLNDGTTRDLGHIIPQDWSILPSVSSLGRYLTGAKNIFEENLGFVRGSLETYDTVDDTTTSIDATVLGQITDLAWSPAEQVLEVGSTSDAELAYCASKKFSIYLPSTNELRVVSELQDGNCYEYFRNYTSNIFSPDGTKVALLQGVSMDLCIADIARQEQQCFDLTRENERIDQLSWSPDSRFIALLMDEGNESGIRIVTWDGLPSASVDLGAHFTQVNTLNWYAP